MTLNCVQSVCILIKLNTHTRASTIKYDIHNTHRHCSCVYTRMCVNMKCANRLVLNGTHSSHEHLLDTRNGIVYRSSVIVLLLLLLLLTLYVTILWLLLLFSVMYICTSIKIYVVRKRLYYVSLRYVLLPAVSKAYTSSSVSYTIFDILTKYNCSAIERYVMVRDVFRFDSRVLYTYYIFILINMYLCYSHCSKKKTIKTK